MNKPFYSFEEMLLEGGYAYTFVSVGKQGSITKLVFLQEIEPNLYNLALVDFDVATQAVDDMSISDNQDMPKIFATVFSIATEFSKALPDASISITGNTPLKRQLYNRIVRNNLADLLQHYEVLGVFETGEKEIFTPFADYFTLIIKPIT